MKRIVVLICCLSVVLTEQEIPEEFILSNSKFTVSVYKELLKNHSSKNFLVSPLSAQLALALSQSGAKNETGEEIRRGLSFQNGKPQIEDAAKVLLSTIESSPHYSLHTANKLYLKENFNIREDFKNVTTEVYKADIENIDFATKQKAAEKMNLWVEEHTDNKIHELVDAEILNNQTRAVLINALLFKGNWSSPFPTYLTMKKNFYLGDKVLQVDTMHDFDGPYGYYESSELDAKFLGMYFEGSNVSMTVVLPNKIDGLAAIEDKLDLAFDDSGLTKETVNVAFPKFKIVNKVDMKEILQNLGVHKAFLYGEADFSEIAGTKGELFITEVVQKSFINVNEDGVEAAAATVIIKIFNRNGEPPKNFVADHPFLFYIKVEGVIIFVGRVVMPTC